MRKIKINGIEEEDYRFCRRNALSKAFFLGAGEAADGSAPWMIKASGVHPVTRCEKAVRPGRNPSHSGMPAGSGTGESCSGSPAVMARMPVLRRLTGPFSRPTCSSRVIKLEGRGDHFPSAISPRTLIKSCIVSILTFRSRIAFFRSIDRDSNLGWSRGLI